MKEIEKIDNDSRMYTYKEAPPRVWEGANTIFVDFGYVRSCSSKLGMTLTNRQG